MNETWLIVAVVVVLMVNIVIGRRWLAAFVAAHQRVPGWSELLSRDEDPEAERWRRWRLVVSIVLFALLGALLLPLLRPVA